MNGWKNITLWRNTWPGTHPHFTITPLKFITQHDVRISYQLSQNDTWHCIDKIRSLNTTTIFRVPNQVEPKVSLWSYWILIDPKCGSDPGNSLGTLIISKILLKHSFSFNLNDKICFLKHDWKCFWCSLSFWVNLTWLNRNESVENGDQRFIFIILPGLWSNFFFFSECLFLFSWGKTIDSHLEPIRTAH